MFAKALYVYIVYRELELYPIRSSNLNYSAHFDATTTESMLRTVTTSKQQLDLFTWTSANLLAHILAMTILLLFFGSFFIGFSDNDEE